MFGSNSKGADPCHVSACSGMMKIWQTRVSFPDKPMRLISGYATVGLSVAWYGFNHSRQNRGVLWPDSVVLLEGDEREKKGKFWVMRRRC